MNKEIQVKAETLPDKIDELHKFILITDEAEKAQHAKVAALVKAESAQAAVDAARQDEYKIKDIGFKAKFKLGELLEKISRKYSSHVGSTRGTDEIGDKNPPKQQKTLPPGIDKKISHKMQTLSRNQDKVREMVKEAQEKDYDPPSDNEIIKRIKKKERAEKQYEKEQDIIKNLNENKREWIVTDNQAIIECDALITDPPYGILNEKWEPKKLEEFTINWAGEWNQCKAEIIMVFWSQRYLWYGRQWFDEAFWEYYFQQLLIWVYRNNKGPQSRKGFKQTWEPIFFYRRKDSKREIGIGGGEWGDDLHDMDTHIAGVPQTNYKDSMMKVHPAQKPVSVMRWLINAATYPGDLIADPFCGSGTTGIAAIQLSRNFHGIEINKEYREQAEKRIICYGHDKKI